MKETTRTSRTAGYLEKIFRAGNTLPKGGHMKITELVTEIRKTAMELNMEFAELVEWLIRENNNTLPWEE